MVYIPGELTVEALYATYGQLIRRHLARLTGDVGAAEDLVHETFVKVLARRQQLAGVENAGAWLFRIATNTAYDHMRRRRRVGVPLSEANLQTLSADPPGMAIEDREQLGAALGRLPDHYRTPFILKHYAGYPLDDIAALLGWKLGTVKSRIYRARAQLQRHYAERGP